MEETKISLKSANVNTLLPQLSQFLFLKLPKLESGKFVCPQKWYKIKAFRCILYICHF